MQDVLESLDRLHRVGGLMKKGMKQKGEFRRKQREARDQKTIKKKVPSARNGIVCIAALYS